jgi:Uma2 family endonuclease
LDKTAMMQLADLDLDKTYSYADYLTWIFEDRVELIDGRIFEISMPNRYHQEVSMVICGEVYNYLRGKPWKVYYAPFDVRLPRTGNANDQIYNVLQSDICVKCDKAKLDKRGSIGAPDIIVEILSLGNNQKELRNKYELYEESGVLEYWIISPQHKTFLKYTLVDGQYQPSKFMTVGDVIATPILPGFELDLETTFAGIKELMGDS